MLSLSGKDGRLTGQNGLAIMSWASALPNTLRTRPCRCLLLVMYIFPRLRPQ